ncbi:type II toxin-antitoxin system death-on-curing family toxin [Sporolactobacillus sp. CPB3-1]|uniref:Type II toxin-antitoxin system death-on-curing family toxin n=1 Tax=Sporolactobacillus mangiferae TaxID=2940498 RepID=A0ABT0M7F9_9BACL|nr:type II toxin-antitoxin system death-on-curing family toxin [Sporolactobacillus mangiferae]MCL1630791.1 type II toxin-antitoxin system death-on-curing family toxin [Sporolactobacillus mangiferae]
MTYYLTKTQVIYLNAFLIRKYSPEEDIGIKDAHLLESAINRPRASAFGADAYPTLFTKAAALFQSLAQNHAFFNANKRTAYASLEVFLRKNGYKIHADPNEKEDFTVKISDQENKIATSQISTWIEKHSIKV